MARKTRRTLWTVIGIIVLYSMGMTIVLPLLPFLLGKYVPDTQIPVTLSLLVAIFAACQFLAAPIFGALSDRFGRKRILLLSLLGSATGFVLLGLGGALWVLFLGRIIDGFTAGDQGTLFAYIIDSTEPQERGKWFGYIGGAIGLGFMIGPAIGGLIGSASITLPFFVTAGITVLSMIIVGLFLPETLPIEKRTPKLSLQSLNTFFHFKTVFSFSGARSLLIMGAFFYVGLNIWQFNASVFFKDVYHWGPSFIGGVFVLVGVCDIVSRVVVLPRLLKIWSERTVGLVGLSGLIIGLALLGLSTYYPLISLVIVAIVCIVLGEGLFDPSYNARLSNSVSDDKQGLLQGVNQSLQALYHVVVPLVAAAIYTFSHAAIFMVAAALMVVGLLLFARLRAQGQVNASASVASSSP